MQIKAKCKFCGRDLTLTVDGDYAALGDPYNLVKLAACNRCADFKQKERRLNGLLQRISFELAVTRTKAESEKLSANAKQVLQMYLRMINERERIEPAVDWDDALLAEFLSNPNDIGRVIRTIKTTVKNAKRQGVLLPQTGLPYRDE